MWTEENGKLINSYNFKDFKEAILFINEIAKICNEVNHHPEIYNCYNNVKLNLFTHDAQDNITEKDHQLALLIDKITI
jgi:4a-hydroxytetrahydrobiopterin dehydratase